MDREKHQGYTNYATFLVGFITDRKTHEQLRAKARARWDAAVPDPEVLWTRSHAARYALMDQLKADAEYELERLENFSLRAVPQIVRDMARAGFCEVDWEDIADHWLLSLRESGEAPDYVSVDEQRRQTA